MIKQNISITCDNCGKGRITDNSYPHTFTLELSIIDTNRNTSNTTYSVHMEPAFKGTKHFCNKKCLGEWLLK